MAEFAWGEGSAAEQARKMEERREVLQEELAQAAASQESGSVEALMREWNALTFARASIVQREVEEANERLRVEGLALLYQKLQELEQLKVFSVLDADQHILHKTITQTRTAVKSYCEKNRISIDQLAKSTAPPAPVAPPPPPPPPPLPNFGFVAKTASSTAPPPPPLPPLNFKLPALPCTPKADRDCGSPKQQTTTYRSRGPLLSINRDVLLAIPKAGKGSLKPTAHKRSPGGTPCRRPRRIESADGGDLIAAALRNKFKNVHGSPRVSSPLAQSPSRSFAESECSSPVSSPR